MEEAARRERGTGGNLTSRVVAAGLGTATGSGRDVMRKATRSTASRGGIAGEPPLVLRGASFATPVAHLATTDLTEIDHLLGAKVSQAAELFRDAPVVLDLERLGPEDIELPPLIDTFRRHRLTPIAVRNGSDSQHAAALRAGLGVLHGGRDFATEAARPPAEPPPPPQPQRGKLVTQPVRSGQRVVAPEGDLVVLASVNTGAEVLAAGHIHVYGPLRGRALAGFRGDASTRILTLSLEAELVAIAGIYRAVEDGWPEPVRKKPAQIYLDGEKLIITALPSSDEARQKRT